MSTKQSFDLEQSMQELADLEQYFNQPDFRLEEAVEKHKRALELAKRILAYLAEAETTIEKLDLASLGSSDSAKEGYEDIKK